MIFRLVFSFFCLILGSYADDENKVPVIAWHIRGSPLQMHSVSAFDTEPQESILKDIFEENPLDESVGVVAYVVDELSMETLAAAANEKDKNANLKSLETFLDKQPHVLYPSVSEPLKHIRKTNCGIHNIHIADEKESILQKSVSKALENSCVVLVHLPEGRTFSKDFYVPSVKGSRKNVIGLFTGRKSSWVVDEPKIRSVRSLDSAEPEDSHFISLAGCIIMYVENITLQIGGPDNDTRELTFPPDVGGSCGVNGSEEFNLELTFSDVGDISKVSINLKFKMKYGSWIVANGSSLTLDGGKAFPGQWTLDSRSFEAPLGFSFSCSDLRLRPLNRDTKVILQMTRFQIQPFYNGTIFSQSFDCVPFFTLPIWMGIFVGLLFIAILNTGIYALFSIKTMDRFDDPKGKTISVPN